MTKIYTKGGDKGQTGLFSGERVDKDHPLVNAYGTVDELNSVLGIARSLIPQASAKMITFANMLADPDWVEARVEEGSADALEEMRAVAEKLPDAQRLDERLHQLQLELFELGAELASGSPGQGRISDDMVRVFEQWIDEMTAGLPELKNFILPTGHPVAAQLHQARTVSRRAERAIVAALETQRFDPVAVRYVNRLADLLFVLAREANRVFGVADEPWKSPHR